MESQDQNKELDEFKKKLTEASEKIDEINSFYQEAFLSQGDKESVSTKIRGLEQELNENVATFNEKIDSLSEEFENIESFNQLLSGDEKNKGLWEEIIEVKEELNNLTDEANNKLAELTDKALHNTFSKRAKDYTEEAQDLSDKTRTVVWIIVTIIATFAIIQISRILFDFDFSYPILTYQFSLVLPFVYLLWFYNRNQKISRKLAEEYHHKASISEAMSGYRNLYELDHTDQEYMELFNAIKDQLNISPSDKIDTFLNLKSPQEEIADLFKKMNPETAKALAEELKPFLT